MIRNPSVPARHALVASPLDSLRAECACGSWWSEVDSHTDLDEAYLSHIDDIEDAQRLRSQRIDRAVARAMNSKVAK